MKTLTVKIDVTSLSDEDADNLAAVLAHRASQTYYVETLDHQIQEITMRTIYATVHRADGVGVLEWRDDLDDLPTIGPADDRYRVNLPASLSDREVLEGLDGLLGGYDLPEGWEVGPVG